MAALALVGGACLGTGTAEASNMGFKLERSFDLARRPDGSALPNVFWVSFPLFNGLGDVGYSDAPPGTRRGCVGDPTFPTGDGEISAIDAICDMWTARRNPGQTGAFQLSYINRDTCSFPSLTGAVSGPLTVFAGTDFSLEDTPGDPLDDDRDEIGYQVNVGASSPTVNPRNPAVIVGSHDPGFGGRMLRTGIVGPMNCGTSAVHTDLINLPYHTMYRRDVEILCGLEGTAWTPDGAGNPTTCFDTAGNMATGIFDGSRPIQVSYFDNTVGRAVARSVARSGPLLLFPGTPFDLVPGEAYRVVIDRTHTPTLWRSPHY